MIMLVFFGVGFCALAINRVPYLNQFTQKWYLSRVTHLIGVACFLIGGRPPSTFPGVYQSYG